MRGECAAREGTTFVELPVDLRTELAWVPGRLVRKPHQRETLCCTQCEHSERAPLRVIDGDK